MLEEPRATQKVARPAEASAAPVEAGSKADSPRDRKGRLLPAALPTKSPFAHAFVMGLSEAEGEAIETLRDWTHAETDPDMRARHYRKGFKAQAKRAKQKRRAAKVAKQAMGGGANV